MRHKKKIPMQRRKFNKQTATKERRLLFTLNYQVAGADCKRLIRGTQSYRRYYIQLSGE